MQSKWKKRYNIQNLFEKAISRVNPLNGENKREA